MAEKRIVNNGDIFGDLTVIKELPFKRSGKRGAKKRFFLCLCQCGNIVERGLDKLLMDRDHYCDECNYDKMRNRPAHNRTHNMTDTNLYYRWNRIRGCCRNPKHHDFYKYGARGINVCDEWYNDFMSFYIWSINNGYERGLTIDRIDNNGGYFPSNCRWVDMKVQSNNRSNNVKYDYNGELLGLSEICRKLGLPDYKRRRILWDMTNHGKTLYESIQKQIEQ